MSAKTQSLPISITELSKFYGSFKALDSVSIDIAAGEFLTLLGPSGSGKTTLLMSLAGFVIPDKGSIKLDNREVITTPPHKRGLGMVFQNYALFPFMTVAENVAYPLKVRKISKSEQVTLVTRALESVQLKGYGDRHINQLSGGQKQRVALARAMVFEPRIILMDEPLSALDKKLREHMQIELKALHQKLDATTVYVTHDQREALTMSDRIAVVNHGKIEQIDTPENLYRRPSNFFVADFVGESDSFTVNFSGNTAYLGNLPLKTDMSLNPKHGAHRLVVRPELIRIGAANEDSEDNEFSACVTDIVYQGDSVLVIANIEGAGEVSVRVQSSRGVKSSLPSVRDTVKLKLASADTIIVPEIRP